MKRWFAGAAGALGLFAGYVGAAQYDFGTIDPATTSGTELATLLNNWRNAVHTLHSGTSRPAYAVANTAWIDTSGGGDPHLKVYNGTVDLNLGPIEGGAFSRLPRGSVRPTYAANGSVWVNNSGAVPVLNYYDGSTDIALGPIAAGGLGTPPGVEAPFAGRVAPTGWLLEYGQEVSRTTYAGLMAAIVTTLPCTTVTGSPTVTVATDLRMQGMLNAKVEGPGVPPAAITAGFPSGTTFTLSANATTGASGTCRIFIWGNGNASTTFNLPDRRGRVIAGRDSMGGTYADRTFELGLNSGAGLANVTLDLTQIPAHNHGSPLTVPYTRYNEQVTVDADDGGGAVTAINRGNTSVNATATIPSAGGGLPFENLQPTGWGNWIIKY